jgi:predicted nucleic acid-binding protein
MKISLDTSIIVEVERRNEKVVKLLEDMVLKRHEIFMSSVVPSEIFTGTYLRDDYRKATHKARNLFSAFKIVPLDIEVAEIIGQINAHLFTKRVSIEYQDVAIAAAFFHEKGDYLLTKNKKHFANIPGLKGKVFTPREFMSSGMI